MRQLILAVMLMAACGGGGGGGSSGGNAQCCKRCSTGKPCGDTCIEKTKTCETPKGCACAALECGDGRYQKDFILDGSALGYYGKYSACFRNDSECLADGPAFEQGITENASGGSPSWSEAEITHSMGWPVRTESVSNELPGWRDIAVYSGDAGDGYFQSWTEKESERREVQLIEWRDGKVVLFETHYRPSGRLSYRYEVGEGEAVECNCSDGNGKTWSETIAANRLCYNDDEANSPRQCGSEASGCCTMPMIDPADNVNCRSWDWLADQP